MVRERVNSSNQNMKREKERGRDPLPCVLPPPIQVMIFPVKLHKVHPETATARMFLFNQFTCSVLGATGRTLDNHSTFPTPSLRNVKPLPCHL